MLFLFYQFTENRYIFDNNKTKLLEIRLGILYNLVLGLGLVIFFDIALEATSRNSYHRITLCDIALHLEFYSFTKDKDEVEIYYYYYSFI